MYSLLSHNESSPISEAHTPCLCVWPHKLEWPHKPFSTNLLKGTSLKKKNVSQTVTAANQACGTIHIEGLFSLYGSSGLPAEVTTESQVKFPNHTPC